MIIEYNKEKNQVSLWGKRKIDYYGTISNVHNIDSSINTKNEHYLFNDKNYMIGILHGTLKVLKEWGLFQITLKYTAMNVKSQ